MSPHNYVELGFTPSRCSAQQNDDDSRIALKKERLIVSPLGNILTKSVKDPDGSR